MKKKILIFTTGEALSHVTRPLEIAKKLKAHGAAEAIFAGSGKYFRLPMESGFRVEPVFELSREQHLKLVSRFPLRLPRDVTLKFVDEEIELIKKIKPDAVLNDHRVTAAASAKITGVPHATILNASVTEYYAPRIKPLKNTALRRILIAPLIPHFRRLMFRSMLKPLNEIMAAKGCSGKLEHGLGGNELTLVADLAEFAPMKGTPPCFCHVGPLVWNPEIPVQEWEKKLDRNKKIIYISMGSTGLTNFKGFFTDLISRFGRNAREEIQLVISTGGQIKEREIGEIPDFCFIEEIIQGMRILEQADLLVCHGGNGTIYQALIMGVPVVSAAENIEQEIHSQRIEELGLGKRVEKHELRKDTGKLVEASLSVLADRRFKEKAQEFKQLLKHVDGAETGAKLIQEILLG